MSISLCVSLLSAITVISFPVETYKYGAALAWLAVSVLIACSVSALYFIPTLRTSGCKSVYGILEKRYNVKVRLFASTTQLLVKVFYMG